uniref:Uncharacterized protein n=1 Tax=Arundo donax TaxID=35708 RepID=A0A0A9ARP9_ARUDO
MGYKCSLDFRETIWGILWCCNAISILAPATWSQVERISLTSEICEKSY